MSKIVLTTIIVVWSAAFSSKADGASLVGQVKDAMGSPITKATVDLQEVSLAATGGSNARASGSVLTDSGGLYSFSSIVPGTYFICVHPPTASLVDNCQDTSALNFVTVPNSGTISAGTIVLRSGAEVTFQITDMSGKLTSAAAFGIVLTSSSGKSVFMKMSQKGSGVAVFTATVPNDVDYRAAFLTGLVVQDSNGVNVAVGRLGSAIATTGRSQVLLVFSVK